VPAMHAASENIHEDGEIEEFPLQADRSHIRYLDLVRPDDFQVPDETGIARERMAAVGGASCALPVRLSSSI
jgi:hypothetical protein